jgi:Flp pilus assembly protein TadG
MSIASLPRRIARRLVSLASDVRGLAAVEFALILPIGLVIFAGSFEADQAYELERKVTITTVEVTDLVTRQSTVTTAQLTTILNAASSIVAPYPVSAMNIVVSEITFDSSGHGTVTWSQSLTGAGALTPGAAITVPASIAQPNTSVIFGQATYMFTPGMGYQVVGPRTLSDQIYRAPRISPSIPMSS